MPLDENERVGSWRRSEYAQRGPSLKNNDGRRNEWCEGARWGNGWKERSWAIVLYIHNTLRSPCEVNFSTGLFLSLAAQLRSQTTHFGFENATVAINRISFSRRLLRNKAGKRRKIENKRQGVGVPLRELNDVAMTLQQQD